MYTCTACVTANSIDTFLCTLCEDFLFSGTVSPLLRSILSEVEHDSRVLSLVKKALLKKIITNLLEQLTICQKALNEFLEVTSLFVWIVHFIALGLHIGSSIIPLLLSLHDCLLSVCPSLTPPQGEASCFP